MVYLVAPYDLIGVENYSKASIEECLAYFEGHQWVAVDTETKGRDPHSKKILSVQLGDAANQFVIDVRHVNILLLKDLLETKGVILHNAKFDYKFFKKAGILLDKIYDTMIAEAVIHAGYQKFGYGLDVVCERYVGVKLDKSTRGEFFRLESQPFNEYQVVYAATDVKYLHRIKELQEAKIQKYDLDYCINLEMEVIKALGDIEYNGIVLNREKWLENTLISERELEQIILQLDDIVCSEPSLVKYKAGTQLDLFNEGLGRRTKINYSSPLQVLRVLKDLGIVLESSGDRELEKVVNDHVIIPKLQEFREKAKIVSTYGRSFLDYISPSTGRLHTSFWQIVSTGRVSSGSKNDNTPNLQNIPGKNSFRNCFEASEGFLWVSCDYSGQELRLMVDAANEQVFIDAINNGEDPHCFAGSLMFGRPVTKADKELRQKSKTVNFGKPYGMGPSKLAETLKVSKNEAKELFKLYANSFPNLNKWLDEKAAFAQKNWYSLTLEPCKRRRWYPEMKEVVREKQEPFPDEEFISKIEGQVGRFGMNHPIQGQLTTALVKLC